MLSNLKTLTGQESSGLARNIVLGFLEALLTGLPFAVLYLVIKQLFQAEPDMAYIWNCCWGLVGLFVLRVIATRSALIGNNQFGYQAGVDMRRNLANKLKRVPLGYLLKKDPGSLNASLLQDVTFTEQIFSHLFTQLVVTISLVSLVAIGLSIENWRLGLAMSAGLPFAAMTFIVMRKLGAVLSRRLLDLVANITGSLIEYILAIKVLQAYNLAGKRFGTLDERLKELQRLSLKHEFLAGVAPLSFICLVEMGFAAMLLTLVYLFVGGALSAEVVVLFLLVSSRFFRPLMAIALFLAEYSFMRQAADRIEEVLGAPELPQGHHQQPLSAEIEFDQVSFAYEEKTILKDVSFQCRPGTLTALVGPSGSGKTTLTSLLARFWDVQQGEIRLGGQPITSLTAENLADHISMVFQEVYLFNDTVWNNLTIGQEGISRAKVIEVCKLTCCYDFIQALPKGLDSVIGEGGTSLSGGEKQRLSIARAILKDAPIVLLDEATASLDPENEFEIQRAINALIQSKTVIMIAHRLNTIVNADQILVLEQGEIKQRGPHNELVNTAGLYQDLWQAQQQTHGWKLRTS